jgi:probable rRNA maturation factor
MKLVNHIAWTCKVGGIPEQRILEAELVGLMNRLGWEGVWVSVVTTDDEELATLNHKWRDKVGPTDVLSFSQMEAGESVQTGTLLGDIVISVESARRQASARRHDLLNEMRVLLVHGLCHLLGHDHEEPEAARHMSALENELLRVMTGAQGLADEGLIRLSRGTQDV